MYKELNRKFSGAIFMLAKKDGNTVDFIGTGFLASKEGHILTCSHIINPLDTIVAIKVGDSKQFNSMTLSQVNSFETILLQNDAKHDVALLKLKTDIGAQVPENIYAKVNDLECGSSVALIGFPFGDKGLHTQTISHGILSSKVKDNNGVNLLQFDCMIHEGYSGSPLIDLQSKQIIGIVTNRFNPIGNGGGVIVNNRQLGTETNISYASSIEYGVNLLNTDK